MMSVFLYVVTLFISFISIGYVFFEKFRFDLEAPIENWVNTANYFNAVFTPPLLAVTSIFILLTWRTSKKELSSTKALLNRQIQELEFKNEFDIFSGRIKNLSYEINKAPEHQFKKFIYMNLLTYKGPSYYNPLFRVSIPEIEKKESNKEKEELILDYINDSIFDLGSSIGMYIKLGGPKLELRAILSNLDNIDTIFKVIVGYIFIESKKGRLWFKTFRKQLILISKIKHKNQQKHMFEELSFNIDSDLVFGIVEFLARTEFTDEQKELFKELICE